MKIKIIIIAALFFSLPILSMKNPREKIQQELEKIEARIKKEQKFNNYLDRLQMYATNPFVAEDMLQNTKWVTRAREILQTALHHKKSNDKIIQALYDKEHELEILKRNRSRKTIGLYNQLKKAKKIKDYTEETLENGLLKIKFYLEYLHLNLLPE